MQALAPLMALGRLELRTPAPCTQRMAGRLPSDPAFGGRPVQAVVRVQVHAPCVVRIHHPFHFRSQLLAELGRLNVEAVLRVEFDGARIQVERTDEAPLAIRHHRLHVG